MDTGTGDALRVPGAGASCRRSGEAVCAGKRISKLARTFCLGLTLQLLSLSSPAQASSVARIWNEAALEAIKTDFPHPPVHARNLFHLSVAMYDAWSAYDAAAIGYVYNEHSVASNTVAARDEAVSHAAYRVLSTRYALSVNATQTLINLTGVMTNLGYNPLYTNTAPETPASVGNRAADAILSFAIDDGSLETNVYADGSYSAVNEPLILAFPGTELIDPNRWQPLAFDFALSQNGLEAEKIQSFLGSQWWRVRPFALTRASLTNAYYDPGAPPHVQGGEDEVFKSNNVAVLRYSSLLDPESDLMIDISPGGPGKNSVLGTHSGIGHATNPATGQPYPSNMVKHADFGRVVAEMWADGPNSETPPGHWNVLANQVSDHPLLERRMQGLGPVLDTLEWDVKIYFAMNGALHDAATAAWTCKRVYDYVRPISSIRWLAGNGQCSDSNQPGYDVDGIYLVSNLIEVITFESTEPGQRHAHLTNEQGRLEIINEIAVNTWPGEPEDGTNSYGGSAWILAASWKPYQRRTFVTPAFPGYVSGHSTFSRAAAEVLTGMTGDPFFPGGYGTHTTPKGALFFERGPTTNIVLQWGTYFDAADEAGISRLYGGIHVAADDFPGRVMGSSIGTAAFELARKYFDGSITGAVTECRMRMDTNGLAVVWNQVRGMSYWLVQTGDLSNDLSSSNDFEQAKTDDAEVMLPATNGAGFFQVIRRH